MGILWAHTGAIGCIALVPTSQTLSGPFIKKSIWKLASVQLLVCSWSCLSVNLGGRADQVIGNLWVVKATNLCSYKSL